MAYGRRSSRKKRSRPRRKASYKTSRRKSKKYRVANSITTKLSYTPTFLVNSALINSAGIQTFAIGDALNASNFLNMYDQFCIKKVTIQWKRILTQVINKPFDDTTVVGLGGSVPTFATCLDYDSQTVALPLADMKNYASYRECLATRSHTRTFTPKMLLQGYRSVTSSCYIPKANQRIDCNQSSTPHFGVRWFLGTASPAAAFQYEVNITLYTTFYNRRTG